MKNWIMLQRKVVVAYLASVLVREVMLDIQVSLEQRVHQASRATKDSQEKKVDLENAVLLVQMEHKVFEDAQVYEGSRVLVDSLGIRVK